MNLPRFSYVLLLKKTARGFFLLRGRKCVPLAKGQKKKRAQMDPVGSNYSLQAGDEGCALLVSFQGVLGWKDANLSMDLLNSKKNFGRKVQGEYHVLLFPPEGRFVHWAALHQQVHPFFRLIYCGKL